MKKHAGFAVCCVGLLALLTSAAVVCHSSEGGNPGESQPGAGAFSGVLVKKLENHVKIETGTCGLLHEILGLDAGLPLTIVIAEDIGPTKAHYHADFTEIYFVLDGSVQLKLLDPASGRIWEEKLSANELCAIGRGIHHVITTATPKNRLCVIAVPGFTGEILSDRL